MLAYLASNSAEISPKKLNAGASTAGYREAGYFAISISVKYQERHIPAGGHGSVPPHHLKLDRASITNSCAYQNTGLGDQSITAVDL